MSNPRILVIDDDAMVTKLLKEHLSEEGYDVTTVHLAEQGFKLATQSPPDLIFLDVMLPDATGFQTVARFRKEPVTSTIPIIMMSGTARNANQLDIAKSMGATDYVVKPFDVIEVGERVGKLVKNKPATTPEPRMIQHVEELPPPPLKPAFSSHIELVPMHEFPAREEPQEEPQAWTLPDRPTVFSEPAVTPEAAAVSPIEIQDEIPTQEEIPPQESPASFTLPHSDAYRATSPGRSFGWIATPLMFTAHMAMTILRTDTDVVQAATYTAGGWALLLGWMVAVCALLQIPMDVQVALKIEGWAAIPIVLRALSVMTGLTFPLPALPAAAFWIRPLDLFELAAILILGISIRKQSGSSVAKSIIAAILIALGWCMTARGYFHPF